MELDRRRVARGRVLDETTRDDPFELERDLGSHATQRRRDTVDHREQLRHGRLAHERSPAGEHLVEHRAGGEDVRAGVGRLAGRLLGGHVGGRADHSARHREAVGHRRRRGVDVDPGQVASEAEVEELELPRRRHHQIARLDVTVDDAGAVRGAERVGHLDREIERARDGQRAALEADVERLAVDELHGEQVDLAIGGRHAVDVEDGDDVRVVERRGGLRLAHEALAARRVADRRRRQHLERHRPLEPSVEGAVDDAHAAGAHLVADRVARQARPAGQLHALEPPPDCDEAGSVPWVPGRGLPAAAVFRYSSASCTAGQPELNRIVRETTDL